MRDVGCSSEVVPSEGYLPGSWRLKGERGESDCPGQSTAGDRGWAGGLQVSAEDPACALVNRASFPFPLVCLPAPCPTPQENLKAEEGRGAKVKAQPSPHPLAHLSFLGESREPRPGLRLEGRTGGWRVKLDWTVYVCLCICLYHKSFKKATPITPLQGKKMRLCASFS